MSGCDFGILLGDNFYPYGVTSTADPLWQTRFELPYADIPAKFYAVLGNHDYGDNNHYWDRGAHQVAYSQVSAKWLMPAERYSFEKINTLFLALNTEQLSFNHDGAVDDQGRFVSGILAASQHKWVIALGHHPYISNGPNSQPPEKVSGHLRRFVENQLCGRADFYISGHDHNLQMLKPTENCNTNFIVSGGGGYATYDLPGKHPVSFQKKDLGFVYIQIDGARLRVEFINTAGDVEYAQDFQK